MNILPSTAEQFETSPMLAAIDMGSNSFHLAIAKVEQGEVRRISAMSEKVQLGAGLDEHNHLSEEAIERGLACLKQFVGRLGDTPVAQMRFVATNALRQAENAQEFMQRANQILPKSLEIIAGREEARLIYLGVSHSLANTAVNQGRRLVVDIGGGSTEFIIGDGFDPLFTESLQLGCVSYTQQYFGNGQISTQQFEKAYLAARKQLRVIESQYLGAGWETTIGSSGTIKATLHVLMEQGLAPDGKIHRKGLKQLKDQVLAFKRTADIKFEGLKEDRKALLPAGLAILTAIFDVLDIETMTYSDGALREGVMYDLVGRLSHEDVRDRSVHALIQRYSVDEGQSKRVADELAGFVATASEPLSLTAEDIDMLDRAARLHEIGLALSHKGFHHHGAYLLQHSDIAGFSQLEQTQLAVLVGAHRRKIRGEAQQRILQVGGQHLLAMSLLLRLAVLLHQARKTQPDTTAELTIINNTHWQLHVNTLVQNESVFTVDLTEESAQFAALGIELSFNVVVA